MSRGSAEDGNLGFPLVDPNRRGLLSRYDVDGCFPRAEFLRMLTPWLVGLAVLVAAVGAYRRYRKFAKRRRAAAFATYGYEVREFQLPRDGRVQYAQWLHPQETPKILQQADVDAVREYVQPGDFVIDIGAHSGDTTLPFALAAGPTGCVLALEPNPYVFEILQANARLNPDRTHIQPLCLAATEDDGEFTFHYSDGAFCNGGFLSQLPNGTSNHLAPLKVQGRNFDRLLRAEYADRLPRWKLLKVDTEGYDRQVLASLRRLIEKYQPIIVCEVLGVLDADARAALFDELATAGYDCFKREETGPLRGVSIARDEMNRWKHFDMLAIPRKVAKAGVAA